jgi:hypothetical protein
LYNYAENYKQLLAALQKELITSPLILYTFLTAIGYCTKATKIEEEDKDGMLFDTDASTLSLSERKVAMLKELDVVENEANRV